MADGGGIGAATGTGTGSSTGSSGIPPTAPVAPIAEFAAPPPNAALSAALLAATVVGRSAEGALLLRTTVGTLALQTPISLPTGTSLDVRLVPGTPPTAVLLNIHDSPPATETPAPPAPPTELNLGTTVSATVRTAAPPVGILPPTPSPTAITAPAAATAPSPTTAPSPAASDAAAESSSASATPAPVIAALPPQPSPVGSTLTLRIVAPPTGPSDAIVIGRVITAAIAETVIDTPIGRLAIPRRLGLAPGAEIAFEQLDTTLPVDSDDQPAARTSGWPAFDHALSVLDAAAPELAARLRADLMPMSGQKLAGTLLFLMGALYQGGWPGDAVDGILARSGNEKLRQRLAADISELQQLATDPATGDWRVLILPLLHGPTVQPVKLYTRRKKKTADAPPDEGNRFIIEIEMSRLGPLQLDGLMRSQRFDLMMRSHHALPADMRQEATALFHKAIDGTGIAGDIAFTTCARFAVAPMTPMRPHVEMKV